MENFLVTLHSTPGGVLSGAILQPPGFFERLREMCGLGTAPVFIRYQRKETVDMDGKEWTVLFRKE